MAARHARLDLSKLSDFVDAWEKHLSQGAVLLPPGTVEGELAPQFKLDVQVPAFGRVGPIDCQIIQRMPDGGIAARVPEMPPKVAKVAERIFDLLAEARAHLLATGELVEPGSERAAAPAAEPTEEPTEEPAEEPLEEPVDELDEEEAAEEASGPEPAAAPLFPDRAGPRGFPIPEHGGPAAFEGQLGDRSLRDTLVRLAAARTHGLLVIDGDPTRYGYWVNGGPVGWRAVPDQPDETLGALLSRAGQLDADTQAQADALMEARGLRLGEALVTLGLLTAEQQQLVLRRQVEYLFKHVLGLRRGRWRFYALPAPPAGDFMPDPVHVVSFLFRTLCAHAASLPPDRIQAAVNARGREWVSINTDLIEVLATGRWSHVEQALLLAVRRKPARARELVDALGGETDVAVALLSFAELGLLQLDKVQSAGPGGLDVQVEQRVRAKHARLAEDHHFDVLEVHWAALGHEIDAAWEARRQEFSREAYAEMPEALGLLVDEVATRLREAHNALRDAGRRERYRREVIDEELLTAVAERFAEEAASAAEAGHAQKAIECWSRAAELLPGEARYADGLRAAGG